MDCVGQSSGPWLAHKQMDVLGHDYVPINAHLKADPHRLQSVEKQLAELWTGEFRLTVKATERYKM
jgi:hypothetical protein